MFGVLLAGLSLLALPRACLYVCMYLCMYVCLPGVIGSDIVVNALSPTIRTPSDHAGNACSNKVSRKKESRQVLTRVIRSKSVDLPLVIRFVRVFQANGALCLLPGQIARPVRAFTEPVKCLETAWSGIFAVLHC
jgi:hypothetical protein